MASGSNPNLAHSSRPTRRYRPVTSSFVFLQLLVFSTITVERGAVGFFTPCNYPVPNDSQFEARCGNNYLHSTYICDVDRQVSITAVEKIDQILSNLEIFSKRYVRIGVAVLRILEYPDWTVVDFFDSKKSAELRDFETGSGFEIGDHSQESIDRSKKRLRRHDPSTDPDVGTQETNPDWYCLPKSQADFYRTLEIGSHLANDSVVRLYMQTFADSLRKRWFGDECAADLFFLAVTDSVIDHYSQKSLLSYPSVQISFGHELKKVLPLNYDQMLQNELSSLSSKGWSPQPIITLAMERLADQLTPQKFMERRTMTTVVIDANGQHQIVTAIVVQHTIPPWAIYTFIGCLGSVGLALGLEWTIVRRKALTLRAGAGGGGGERHRSSKSDNVQVHLYF